MNWKTKKTEIKELYFGGLIPSILFGVLGFFILYLLGIFRSKSLAEFTVFLLQKPIGTIGIIYVVFSLYLTIRYFLNMVLPPKTEVLYLLKRKENSAIFVSKNGKKFDYEDKKNLLETNCYYSVIKIHDYILEVKEKADDDWMMTSRRRYWRYFYTSIGNFENRVLRFSLWFLIFICALHFSLLEDSQKAYVVLMVAFPCYLFLYDLLYKIKLKTFSDDEMREVVFLEGEESEKKTLLLLATNVLCALSLVFFSIFLKSDPYSKIVYVILLFVCIACLCFSLFKIFQEHSSKVSFVRDLAIISIIGVASFFSVFLYQGYEKRTVLSCSKVVITNLSTEHVEKVVTIGKKNRLIQYEERLAFSSISSKAGYQDICREMLGDAENNANYEYVKSIAQCKEDLMEVTKEELYDLSKLEDRTKLPSDEVKENLTGDTFDFETYEKTMKKSGYSCQTESFSSFPL